jgi:flavin reductase (DIM6/NTAB) family NADH-FMN oxidoreductase RutF
MCAEQVPGESAVRVENLAEQTVLGVTGQRARTEDVLAFHRRALSGVTILTTMVDGQPRGMAINAFASVSLDPPTVLVCVARAAGTYAPLLRSGRFGVNLLAADQIDIAGQFARSGGAEKFENVPWRVGEYGSPILSDTCGYLEALIDTRVDAYTHSVFFGRVLGAGSYPHTPLAYLAGHLYDARDPQAWVTVMEGLDPPAGPDRT